MMQLNPGYGQPVRSLQTFLRKISQYYKQVPPVIPDGIFGLQTRDAVVSFQAIFAMPINGVVDNDVWDKIIAVYDSIIQTVGEPNQIKIFPSGETIIYPGASNVCLYALQGILFELTQHFTNLGKMQITGVHDEASVAVTKNIQAVSGLDTTGVIDRFVWDKIARIYEAFISNNRVDAAG